MASGETVIHKKDTCSYSLPSVCGSSVMRLSSSLQTAADTNNKKNDSFHYFDLSNSKKNRLFETLSFFRNKNSNCNDDDNVLNR